MLVFEAITNLRVIASLQTVQLDVKDRKKVLEEMPLKKFLGDFERQEEYRAQLEAVSAMSPAQRDAYLKEMRNKRVS